MPFQMIINGGFESGALEPGWRQVPGSAQLDGGVTTIQAHSGSYSLELRGYDFVEQRYSGVRATGDLTFWLLRPSSLIKGDLFLTAEYSDASYDSMALTSYASDSWTEVSVAINHSKCLIGIRFNTVNAEAYFIDDISLQGLLADHPHLPDFPQSVYLPPVWPNFPQSVYLPPSYFQLVPSQTIENRLVHIENILNQLSHYITRELRPKAKKSNSKKGPK